MIEETRALETFAKDHKLDMGIVYARPVNSREDQAFYLVAEDGALLNDPKLIGRTVEDARSFIYRQAMLEDYRRRQQSEPYYGG